MLQSAAEEKLTKTLERLSTVEAEASGAKKSQDSLSGVAAAQGKKVKALEDKIAQLTAQTAQLQVPVVWCGVVWCGVVWCGVVWCGVVWCGVVWCGVVWCIADLLRYSLA